MAWLQPLLCCHVMLQQVLVCLTKEKGKSVRKLPEKCHSLHTTPPRDVSKGQQMVTPVRFHFKIKTTDAKMKIKLLHREEHRPDAANRQLRGAQVHCSHRSGVQVGRGTAGGGQALTPGAGL